MLPPLWRTSPPPYWSGQILSGFCGRNEVSRAEPSVLCGTQTGHLAADADGVLYLPTPVCGDRATMYVSTDSGLTWSEEVINNQPMPFTDPAIDFDAAGNLHAVWVDNARQLNYSMSADKGLSWIDPVLATLQGPAMVLGQDRFLELFRAHQARQPVPGLSPSPSGQERSNRLRGSGGGSIRPPTLPRQPSGKAPAGGRDEILPGRYRESPSPPGPLTLTR